MPGTDANRIELPFSYQLPRPLGAESPVVMIVRIQVSAAVALQPDLVPDSDSGGQWLEGGLARTTTSPISQCHSVEAI